MRIDKRVAIATAVLGGVSVTAAVGSAAATEADNTLRGTWQVQVDPDPAGGQDAPPFESTLSFGHSGVVTEATSRAPSSAGLGAWQRTGANTYVFEVQKYRFDAVGVYAGKTVIRESVSLSGDGSYTGTAVTRIVNPAGMTVATFSSHTAGSKLTP